MLDECNRDFANRQLLGQNYFMNTSGIDEAILLIKGKKGTVVKRIKLVHDNTDHIEGKVNEQVIVILTKYTKKL